MAFNAQFEPNGHPFPETLPVSDRPHNPATELESCKAIPASGEVLQSTEQLKFEVMLGELLTTFINVPASQLDAHILEAQKRICETLGLDRSSLAQRVEGDDIIVTHRWVADGSDDSRPLSTRDIPWLARKLLGGQVVCLARLDDLPEEAANDKEALRQSGIKSTVLFPLSAAGKMLGGLGFTSCRVEREWPASLVRWLGIVAQVFANALSRAQSDKNLLQAYRQIEELKQRVERERILTSGRK